METTLRLLWQVSWQTAALAGVVFVVTRLARKAPASWRHALWLIVLVKPFVPPFAQIPAEWAFWVKNTPAPVVSAVAQPTGGQSEVAGVPLSAPAAATAPDMMVPDMLSGTRSPGNAFPTPDWPKLAAIAWLVGIAFMTGVFIRRYTKLSGIVRTSRPTGDQWADMLSDAAGRMRVRMLPEIRLSDDVPTPMLAGLFHPVILLPTGIETVCTDSDLFAIFSHELAHIKRRDVAASWFTQLATTIYFFHPAVWLANREMRRERELACDEMVLTASGITREAYAAGYVSALKLANGQQTDAGVLAMAEPFDLEKRRLQSIKRTAIPKMTARWVVALVLLAGVGLATVAGCSKPTSEVSIKEAETLVARWIEAHQDQSVGGRSPALEDITTTEMRSRLHVQVFRVKGDTGGWDPDSYMLSASRVYPMGSGFGGSGLMEVRVCDLDSDGSDELVYVFSCGSGVHRSVVEAYQFDGTTPARSSALTIEGADVSLIAEPGRRVSLQTERVLYAPRKRGVPRVEVSLQPGAPIGTISLRKTARGGVLEIDVAPSLPLEWRDRIVTSVGRQTQTTPPATPSVLPPSDKPRPFTGARDDPRAARSSDLALKVLSVFPNNGTISAYEPVVVQVQLTNISSSRVFVSLRGDVSAHVELRGYRGTVLASSPLPSAIDYAIRRIALNPGQSLQSSFIPSAIYQFKDPGEYVVVVMLLDAYTGTLSGPSDFGPTIAETSLTVRVRPWNEAALKSLCDNLIAPRMLNPSRLSDFPAHASMMALWSVRHNAALPTLKFVAQHWGDTSYGWPTAVAIRRIGTPESAALLKNLASRNDRMGRAARSAIEDKAVLRISEDDYFADWTKVITPESEVSEFLYAFRQRHWETMEIYLSWYCMHKYRAALKSGKLFDSAEGKRVLRVLDNPNSVVTWRRQDGKFTIFGISSNPRGNSPENEARLEFVQHGNDWQLTAIPGVTGKSH